MVDDGNLRYYHGDHLGSSNAITDDSGTQIALYEYKPFGEVSIQSGTYSTNIKYTGKIQDDTGLYYYGARYYDPVIGRFITPDPTVQHPKDPQDLNRYSYCRNNPINLIDPTGLGWKSFWKKLWKQIRAPFIATITAAAIVFTWGALAPGMTGLGMLFSKAGATIVSSAAATTAVLDTGEGRQFTNRLGREVFDDVFGMSPKNASMFANIFAYMAVNMGFQFGFARFYGANKTITGAEKIDTSSEAAEAAAIAQEGKGVNFGTRPEILETGPNKSVLSGFDKLLKSGKETVGVAAEALNIGGKSQHLGTMLKGLNMHSDMASIMKHPFKAISQGYLTFGVSHTATNISLLNSGYHTTINSLLSGGWLTLPSTFIYGPYGHGLTGAITNRQIIEKNE